MTIKVFMVAEMVAAERAADAAGVFYDEMTCEYVSRVNDICECPRRS